MRFTTQQKTTEITSLEMWVMAFSKYASVRVLYYSEEGMGLFRHLFLVTQLFQTYPGSKAYLEYDSAYRHHLANVPSFKWGDPLNDCYLLAQHMGLRDGQRIFLLNFHGKIVPAQCKNLLSVSQNIVETKRKIEKEIALKRVAGPFISKPMNNLHLSPLGLVPKRDGKFRLIHNLSYPEGNSVNDGIPPEFSKVSYQTLDDAIRVIRKLGRGSLIAKADIQDAFRLIPIRPKDHHLLGFTFDDKFFYDLCLPMGSSGSCFLFERFSSAPRWALQAKYSVSDLVHILDDFMFFGPASSDVCRLSLDAFMEMAAFINLPVKEEKTVFPSTCATLFGIEVDTVAWELRLPMEKLVNLRSLLSEVKTLQSLLGHLNFACMVVVPGRTSMRRLQNLLCKMNNPKPDFWLRLNSESQADINAWKLFVDSHFHGKSLMLNDSWSESDEIELFTDAAESTGCAAVYCSHWFVIEWENFWKNFTIAVLELFPIVVAIEIWGPLWRNHQICFRSDNTAVVEVINKQSARDKMLMTLVRKLVISAMKFNINIKARHIPGIKNTKADLLSRFQVQKARQLFPDLEVKPTVVPPHLMPTAFEIKRQI